MDYGVSVWKDTGWKDSFGKPVFSQVYHQEHPTKQSMDRDFAQKRAVYRAEDGYYITSSSPG
jgi:hypothetical protein